jgi:hypothetical protein
MGALMAVALVLPLLSCEAGEQSEAGSGQTRMGPPRGYTAPDLASRTVDALSDPVVHEVVYVPAYSHVYANGGRAYLLEVMLSVRNTDQEQSIVLSSVRYYDTSGALKRTFVEQPVRIGPMETLEFLVEKTDSGGGSGANFIVEWMAEEVVEEPLIEAVMVAADRQLGLSIVRQGVPLTKHE